MEVLQLDSGVPLERPWPAVTVGNFDGVHRGHQALVEVTVREARLMEGTAVVLTFDPHPSRVLAPQRAPSALMTLDQRAEALADLGVDLLVVLRFDVEVARQSAAQFAQSTLRERLGARVVVVGSNFRFGHGREGNLPTLEALGRSLGFRVREVPAVQHGGERISSTRIRDALARGAVGEARDLLGRPFFVDGRVVAGAGRGRGLGFPTANLEVVNETLPAAGVYAGWCGLADAAGRRRLPSVANLGRRPTFGGSETTVEVHVLDFSGDLYGQQLRFEFRERLREERGFSGPGPLAEQIARDIASARTLLERP